MGDAAKAFAVLCSTLNGIPLVYSGQEIPNHKALTFFEKDLIEWNANTELHDFYKTLLTAHKNNPALHAGQNSLTRRIKTSAEDKIFSFLRKNGDDEVLVFLNLSADSFEFSLNENVEGKFREIFSGVEKDFSADQNLELDGWQWLVFDRQ